MDSEERKAQAIKDHTQYQYVLKNDPEKIRHLYETDDMSILSDDEKMTTIDIMHEYNKKLSDLEIFLKTEYMVFNHKIHNCLLNYCYDDIFKRRDIVGLCLRDCTSGVKNAEKFVNARLNDFSTSFSTCVEQTQLEKTRGMQDTIKCYDKMLNTFDKIKKEVKQEFKNYE
jgi:hypothetical protein